MYILHFFFEDSRTEIVERSRRAQNAWGMLNAVTSPSRNANAMLEAKKNMYPAMPVC